MNDDECRDFKDFLEQIIDSGQLDQPALGITKLVIDKGERSLSDKQRDVFQKYVLDEYTNRCKRCDTEIPWNEMYRAVTEDGMCDWCSSINKRETERE